MTTEAAGKSPWWANSAGASLPAPLPQSAEEVAREAARIAERGFLRDLIRSGPVPPEYYDRLAAQGMGWKLHLNFDPFRDADVARVRATLTDLRAAGAFPHFKIGNRGGVVAGQPGKEATVYVGSKDNAETAAGQIEEKLSDILLPPDPDALISDIPLTALVAGRFDAPLDGRFHQYGTPGHPILDKDMTLRMPGVPPDPAEKAAAIGRADALLRETYGTFYTGTTPAQQP